MYKHPGAGLEHVGVNRPRVYLKQDTKVMFQPKLSEIHRAKTKDNTKITYFNEQGPLGTKELVADHTGYKKQIPAALLENRRDEYSEYPGQGHFLESKPESCIPTTFNTSGRFKDPVIIYNDHKLPISPIDFEHYFHKKNARSFKGYSERKDMLLTKSQEELLALMKEEQHIKD